MALRRPLNGSLGGPTQPCWNLRDRLLITILLQHDWKFQNIVFINFWKVHTLSGCAFYIAALKECLAVFKACSKSANMVVTVHSGPQTPSISLLPRPFSALHSCLLHFCVPQIQPAFRGHMLLLKYPRLQKQSRSNPYWPRCL